MNKRLRSHRWSPLVLITLLTLGIGWPSRVEAQNFNGIFFPRSSEQFFQEGIERMEREARALQNADRMPNAPSLDIDESILIQQEMLELEEDWLMNLSRWTPFGQSLNSGLPDIENSQLELWNGTAHLQTRVMSGLSD